MDLNQTSPQQDEEHLKLLSIFSFVLAGLTALLGCFPIIHVVMGVLMLSGAFVPDRPIRVGPEGEPIELPDPIPVGVFGGMFAGAGCVMILIFWTMALCVYLKGRNLQQRKNYTFCLVIAAIECTAFPVGTALGVFTILVLIRPRVKQMFGAT